LDIVGLKKFEIITISRAHLLYISSSVPCYLDPPFNSHLLLAPIIIILLTQSLTHVLNYILKTHVYSFLIFFLIVSFHTVFSYSYPPALRPIPSSLIFPSCSFQRLRAVSNFAQIKFIAFQPTPSPLLCKPSPLPYPWMGGGVHTWSRIGLNP